MTAAVVLAAGASRRFGGNKLLVSVGRDPLVRRAVEEALDSAADEVVVVVGRDAERVREALEGLAVRFAPSDRWEEGMGASIRAGIEALPAEAEAALILLGDQPTVTSGIIDRVIESHRETGRPIAAPVYRGVQGNPVLFHRSVFGELRALEGDRGAREVVERDADRVAEVPFPFEVPADVDTPEDYQRLVRRLDRG